MPSSISSTLQVTIPGVSPLYAPFTLDLHFRIDSLNGANFVLLGYANLGFEQTAATLFPISIPSACDVTTTLESNKWNHITLSMTAPTSVDFALSGIVQCTTTSL